MRLGDILINSAWAVYLREKHFGQRFGRSSAAAHLCRLHQGRHFCFQKVQQVLIESELIAAGR